MSRWEPNAQSRLSEAALELYLARGYDKTTVADIAERAGLTERTFFRYFADKREALFAGSARLEAFLTSRLSEALAPETSVAPIDAVTSAIESLGELFDEIGIERARRRSSVISANLELRERELMKMASLSKAIADSLRGHGMKELPATLAAETGIAIFKLAFERWLEDPRQRAFAVHVRECVKALKVALSAATR